MITISIFSWIKTSSTVVNSPVLLGIIPLSLFPHTETLTAELWQEPMQQITTINGLVPYQMKITVPA
jgi:hypothetical protein